MNSYSSAFMINWTKTKAYNTTFDPIVKLLNNPPAPILPETELQLSINVKLIKPAVRTICVGGYAGAE